MIYKPEYEIQDIMNLLAFVLGAHNSSLYFNQFIEELSRRT